MAVELQAPVILVVGMKLGCINHALLTADAIRADGLRIAAWVANQIDPQMLCFDENLSSLKALLGVPFLGVVPYLLDNKRGVDAVSAYKDISIL